MLKKIRKIFRNQQPALIDRTSELRAKFPDFDDRTIQLIKFVEPYTMTSPERINALVEAIDYVTANEIDGDIVECGVWRGGSMMAAATALIERSSTGRELILFDTFEGMPPASDVDRDFCDVAADTQLAAQDKEDPNSIWCFASIEDVKQNLSQTQYPSGRIRMIKGRVEDTLLSAPFQSKEGSRDIAVLRLDTDWYESTKVCLKVLYPRLVEGGILIIDDYGHWKGCRKAVDEYFAEQNIAIFLQRIDYTGRLAIKPVQQHAQSDRTFRKELNRFSA